MSADRRVQVWVVSADNAFWEHALLIRDYLRAEEQARQNFQAQRPMNWAEKVEVFTRILPDAQRWWVAYHGFGPLETVAAEFGAQTLPAVDIDAVATYPAADFPWYISSGWAVDLFLGKVTRVHRDVDIVVPFKHQMALQAHLLARGWKLLTPLNERLEPWPPHMLLELPRHQIHAHRAGAFIDLLLTDIDHSVWCYRRDPVILRHTSRMAFKSDRGLPYLAPDLVLLFKSRNTGRVPRPQDQLDFEQILPLLEPERRAWLRWAIQASDPENLWLKML